MSIDPRELQRHTIGRPVEAGETCRGCGYDLTGLGSGGRCPECGAAIGLSKAYEGRYADNLVDAPPHYLRSLLLSMAAVAILAIALLFAQGSAMLATGAGAVMWGGVFLAVSLAWVAAVCFATRQRAMADHTIPDATLDSARFRATIRALQIGWPLAAIIELALTRPMPGGLAVTLEVAQVIVLLVAFVGLGLLAFFLRALADWAGEDGLAGRYLASAWGLSVCSTLALVLGVFATVFLPRGGALGFFAGFAALGEMIARFLAVLGHLLFLFCNAQLAWMVRWALVNHDAAVERDLRVAERRAERVGANSSSHPVPASAIDDDPIERLPSTSDLLHPTRPLPKRSNDPIPLAEPDPPAANA